MARELRAGSQAATAARREVSLACVRMEPENSIASGLVSYIGCPGVHSVNALDQGWQQSQHAGSPPVLTYMLSTVCTHSSTPHIPFSCHNVFWGDDGKYCAKSTMHCFIERNCIAKESKFDK